MSTPFKMKGFSGFGNSPVKDKDLPKGSKSESYKESKSKSTPTEISMSEEEALNMYVSTELKKRQDKRQPYMHKSVAVGDAQDEIDIADIKSKIGKIKGKDYY